MKSTVRTSLTSRIAAVAMALPLGAAMLLAQPAHATPAVVAQPGAHYVVVPAHAVRAHRDDRAPRITQLTPSNGARVGERGRTSIHARFDDQGSGIDRRSVQVKVDGLDVTRDARIGDDQLTYVERLGRGRHSAEVVVKDRAGNATRSAWTFRVV